MTGSSRHRILAAPIARLPIQIHPVTLTAGSASVRHPVVQILPEMTAATEDRIRMSRV
jgi:hypothetical protein